MKAVGKAFFLLLSCLLLSVTMPNIAAGAPVGVVYPNMRAPYDRVFNSIIEGVEQRLGMRVDRYALDEDFTRARLGGAMKAGGHEVVVALGQRGVEAVADIQPEIPVVFGAVLPSAKNSGRIPKTGIYLVPDPELLFKQLKSMAPSVKTISVVFNPDKTQFILDKAFHSAAALGLIVDARPARDLRTAAQLYKEIFNRIDPKTNAIWLLQDATTIDSDTVLPALLAEAWDRSLVVFSSSLAHVSRGVLFSMYPDNQKMGKELAELVLAVRKERSYSGEEVLRSLKLAVNIRTAKHLRIELPEREVDLIFPRR